jgi:hypothetical protein
MSRELLTLVSQKILKAELLILLISKPRESRRVVQRLNRESTLAVADAYSDLRRYCAQMSGDYGGAVSILHNPTERRMGPAEARSMRSK